MDTNQECYRATVVLRLNDPEDRKVYLKLHNRDRTQYESIVKYVKAAIIAFDDKKPLLDCSDSAKKELLDDIKELLQDTVIKGYLQGMFENIEDIARELFHR